MQLLEHPFQKALWGELLRRLRGGVVNLARHTVTVGVDIDA
jgi:hypothetical protein